MNLLFIYKISGKIFVFLFNFNILMKKKINGNTFVKNLETGIVEIHFKIFVKIKMFPINCNNLIMKVQYFDETQYKTK